MRFEIYDPVKPEGEPPVMLKLEKHMDNVYLLAVDKGGDCIALGHILTLDPRTGRIVRTLGVDPDLGFDLDGCGRVVVA